ncbi:hypothetical protein PVL29_011234 [Vitis rotundifolia]|uniref:Uncharacterized protein n=1 Tax=Vitis rotundifolia TaxID=103349 RepID=A0AA39DP96_VITRO|nr:hypothetical protein PVL29_011234 [Vitis rotundifolia]
MSKLMLVVSAELKNICEHCGEVSQNEARVYINVTENSIGNRRNDNLNLSRKCQGCERQGKIRLIPRHGAPLSQNHCTEVDLMLFNCDGLLSVEYSFNGEWLAIMTSGREIHVDLAMGGYMDAIDGVEVSISNLKAKFVSY